MRKAFRIALPTLIGGLLACIVWRALHDQPYYGGESLEAWLQHYGDARYLHDQKARENAESAIRHIGTNALPTLLIWIGKKDSALENAVRRHLRLNESTWGRIGFRTASRSRGRAVDACQVLGAIAKPIVPGLINLLQDPDPGVRACAASALLHIGPAAEAAVPALLQNLRAYNQGYDAVPCLQAIGVKPSVVVPILIENLSSTNSRLRWSAIWRLADYGTNASGAVPNLLKLLSDRDPSVRNAATNALLKIDSHKIPVSSLVQFLNVPDRSWREAATNALREIDPQAAAEAGIR